MDTTQETEDAAVTGPDWPELLDRWMKRNAHRPNTASAELGRRTPTIYGWISGRSVPHITDAADLANRMGLEAVTVRRSILASQEQRARTHSGDSAEEG